MRLRHIGCLLLCAHAGCAWASQSRVDALEKQIKNHETRIAKIESGVQVKVTEAQAKLREIEAVLERATRAVTRNNADLGVQVGELRNQVSVLEGQVAELRRELELRSKTASDSRATQSESERVMIPADADSHWKAGELAFTQEQYNAARTLFREFHTRYAEDPRADDALYKIGESYMLQNKPGTALGDRHAVLTQA